MNIVKFNVGDKIEVHKQHPCGSKIFRILRTGSDVRLVCEGCGRDLTLDRLKVEKIIKKVISDAENE